MARSPSRPSNPASNSSSPRSSPREEPGNGTPLHRRRMWRPVRHIDRRSRSLRTHSRHDCSILCFGEGCYIYLVLAGTVPLTSVLRLRIRSSTTSPSGSSNPGGLTCLTQPAGRWTFLRDSRTVSRHRGASWGVVRRTRPFEIIQWRSHGSPGTTLLRSQNPHGAVWEPRDSFGSCGTAGLKRALADEDISCGPRHK